MPFVARLLGVRPGEGSRLALVAALFAAIEAARGFGEVGADTLVISRFGPGFLPVLYVGLGLVSLIAAVGFGAALGRFRRGPLLIGFLAMTAAAIVILGVTSRMTQGAIVPLWLAVFATGAIAVTISWAVAGSVFDVRQAKRLFPICTAAAIAGGFAGTLGAGPLARAAGTEALVVAEALLLGGAALLIGRIALPSAQPRAAGSIATELRAGLDVVRTSPLLRLVAVAYVLFSVLNFSLTFPFFAAMDRAFPNEADLAGAIGLLSAAITALSFVVSLVVAPPLYARLGVATAALLLPLVYVAGFVTWLAQFSITTAAGVRIGQQVTQRGVSNAAWSAFYSVVPGQRRAQVLAFMDGVPGQLGIALSGLLLLATTGAAPGPPVFVMGLIAALTCTLVVVGIRRRYADSLLRTLRSGMGERLLEGGPGLAALTGGETATALVGGLSAPEPAVRRMAAELLGRVSGRAAVSALAASADDADPRVRVAVLDALASLRADAPEAREAAAAGFEDPEPAVRAAAIRASAAADGSAVAAVADRLSADTSPVVRAALAVALIRNDEEDRPHALLANLLEAEAPADRIAGLEAVGMLGGHAPSRRIPDYLQDPEPDVRAAAVRALAAVDGMEDLTEPFLAALADDASIVRRAAATVLRDRPQAADGLVDILMHGPATAQEAALAALDGHGPDVREALLTWSTGQVARADRLRSQRMALGTADLGAHNSAGFLAAILARREAGIELRLLRALAVLGAPEAGGLIRRCLQSNDPEIRAQAIEALDSIGDGHLRRAIVRLLDDRVADPAADRERALGELTQDGDPWIRALAIRARAEQLAATWSTLREAGTSDPDPIVQSATRSLTAERGPAMPDQTRAFDDIDRMLFLRRVPLFAELEPEDLQRIAAAATEAWYAAEEALVREGDIGHDMVLIVEGEVRVVRTEPDGTIRQLTRYAAGDVIGELALLRERPRAATVIAEAPGVRGLVIDGEGLMAILRERPQAAMAMLATLAERIGSQ